MLGLLAELPLAMLLGAGFTALVAGFVKGAVGFALPMILISGLGSLLPAEIALAGLILPTLTANLFQGLSGGLGAAWAAVRQFGTYIVTLLIVLTVSAQAARFVPDQVLFLFIGIPITLFAVTQLIGWTLRLAGQSRSAEIAIGVVAGMMSGFAGTWGPPTVMYLAAINAEKALAMRAQGVIYLVGSVMLAAAHTQSGILNAATLPFSLALIVPVLIGMWIGGLAHDRMNQARFRQMMLWVLLIAGLNLIRRALMG